MKLVIPRRLLGCTCRRPYTGSFRSCMCSLNDVLDCFNCQPDLYNEYSDSEVLQFYRHAFITRAQSDGQYTPIMSTNQCRGCIQPPILHGDGLGSLIEYTPAKFRPFLISHHYKPIYSLLTAFYDFYQKFWRTLQLVARSLLSTSSDVTPLRLSFFAW